MSTKDHLVDAKEAIDGAVKELQVARGLDNETAQKIRETALAETTLYDEERKKACSPPGAFNLPAVLEKRRLDWRIPDGCFACAPGTLYDRILLWQIPLLADTLEDAKVLGGRKGFLAATHLQQEASQRGASRGVIVGAGLHALDSLRSHGVDLGHIVYFAINTTYAIKIDQIAGIEERISLAREGDLILSEDLAASITRGDAKVHVFERTDKDGLVHREHYYMDKEGRRYNPMLPYPEDDL